MADTQFTRKTCRLCGSDHLVLGLPLKPTPLADAYIPKDQLKPQEIYPLDLMLCESCGHVQTGTVVYPEEIYINYIYETTSSVGLPKHFVQYADQVLARAQFQTPKLVLDIGSNDGTLLKCFKARGMSVLGVDPAREIARRATEAGIETLGTFFNTDLAKHIVEKYGQASIMTSNNLVANVDDLDDFFSGIRTVLAPDGYFFFESFYLADFIQNMVFDFAYHEHLSYFSVKPIQQFVRKHGLELVDVEAIKTKGGSLRYVIRHQAAGQASSPTVAHYIEQEQAMGVQTLQGLTAFADKILEVKANVRNYLQSCQAQGLKIAGYGASATSTTLVYHFGLGDFLDYFVDEYQAKQGLYSPGLHLPVYSPEVLSQAETKPDVVLVLAWRFAEGIIAKNQAFLAAGGQFAVPLPQLNIIKG